MTVSQRRTGVIGMGYEGQGLDVFLNEALAYGVTTVADVRLNAISRKPGFSKRALAAALADHGVDYVHVPRLGNPKWNRPGFGGSASELTTARTTYAEQISVPESIAQLDELARTATHGLTALVCFEADERRCHRYVLLDRLRARLLQPAAAL